MRSGNGFVGRPGVELLFLLLFYDILYTRTRIDDQDSRVSSDDFVSCELRKRPTRHLFLRGSALQIRIGKVKLFPRCALSCIVTRSKYLRHMSAPGTERAMGGNVSVSLTVSTSLSKGYLGRVSSGRVHVSRGGHPCFERRTMGGMLRKVSLL